VAQTGSAPALGAGGRQFKSDRPDQLGLDLSEIQGIYLGLEHFLVDLGHLGILQGDLAAAGF
jgi:hypothetical protein